MDLICNPVLNREGKKWKLRWAVLKKVSPKSSGLPKDFYYYLFFYKDASHAVEGKEKCVIPLDFCGLDVCSQYDKANNVLIVVTTSQTIFLSFKQKSVRDQWEHILVSHFGNAVTYDISIPDKQKLKSGEATIRLYPAFFSIVTNKNYRCLNRWYTNDIHSYVAVDNSHFMFEVAPPMKSKGTVVNLEVPDNAEEVAKTFDEIVDPTNSSSLAVHSHLNGSAILDELGQARRNVGDQSFFKRIILRASDRMRKRRRGRTQSAAAVHKKASMAVLNSSMTEEARFCSLNRKKSPNLSVNLTDSSVLSSIARSQSSVHPSSRAELRDPPELPKKGTTKYPAALNEESSSNSVPALDKRHAQVERTLLKPRSMTTNDIPTIDHDNEQKPKMSRSAELISNQPEMENNNPSCSRKENMVEVASDRSDIASGKARVSADSYASAQKSTGKHAMAKPVGLNKIKANSEETPTPPPRSPVSLGFPQTTVFEFSLNEDLNPSRVEKQSSGSLLDEIDNQLNRRTIHSDASDDAFLTSGENLSNNNTLYQSAREPVYGNVQAVRNSSDSNTLTLNNGVVRRRNFRHNSTKHLSDPLMVDVWTKATSDGKIAYSSGELKGTEYINVKGTSLSDDDNDSYVNVTSGEPNERRKKTKPTPLRLKSYKNEFEKYDDEDSSIYHAVGVFDNDSTHSVDGISYSNQSDGSYENINANRRNPRKECSDYSNLMSPASNSRNSSKLNYIVVGKADMFQGIYLNKSNSGSPVRSTPRSPIETFNKSDYTRIDQPATIALKKSMDDHQRRSPTKITK